jgi:eukaryotic-like serine/threonine-protein kinase
MWVEVNSCRLSGVEAAQILGDRYSLDRKIGEGGMSVVWQAQDEVLGRPVAVKVLAAAYTSDAASRRRIRAEAQAAARLSHPHITGVYDYGESVDEDGNHVPYIVMELLPGRTLAERLAEGPLRPRAGLRVCAEVASALAAAHAHDLVHRDVKPANVVLTAEGAKVVDFGIAAAVGQPDELDLDSPVFGTPAYLAPERLTGDEVIAASDVYALGLLLYRVLTDRLPWHVETTTQMLTAHVYVEPERLPQVVGLPPEVAEIYQRCVAKDPADRPPASEVAVTLAKAAGIQLRPADDDSPTAEVPAFAAGKPRMRQGSPPTAPPAAQVGPASPVGPAIARPAPRRRRRAGSVAVGLLVAAALAGVAVAVSGSIGDTGPVNAGPVAEGADGIGVAGPGSTEGSGSPTGGAVRPTTAGPGVAPAVNTSPGPGAEVSRGGNDVSPAPSPTPSTDPTLAQRTLSSDGGSVVAVCRRSGKAQLLSIDPAPGYSIKKAIYGPAEQVGVVFKAPGTAAVRMRVTCINGEPVASTGEE